MADYHSLLMRAVANLPNAGTPASRGAIYGRAKKALLEQLRSLRPPLPESDIEREEKALDKAIAEIEGKYGSEGAAEPAPAAAAATPPAPAAAKPGAAPAPTSRPPQPAAIQRPAAPAASGPSAPPARPPAQAKPGQPESTPGAPIPPGAAQRPQSTAQGRSPAAAPPRPSPQAPTAPAAQARRSRVAGRGFAGSIAAGGCDGQFVFGPDRSFGRLQRRQGRGFARGDGA